MEKQQPSENFTPDTAGTITLTHAEENCEHYNGVQMSLQDTCTCLQFNLFFFNYNKYKMSNLQKFHTLLFRKKQQQHMYEVCHIIYVYRSS